MSKEIELCALMKTGWWKTVREFRDSGGKEDVAIEV
jgi:hypothetical protein